MGQETAPPFASGEPSTEIEETLRLALGEIEAEDWEGASSLLLQALETHPGDPYLLCWLGLAERELGLESTAYERFRRALAAGSEDPVLLATVGNALAASGDPAAEAALRTAALLAPDLPQARWMYGAHLAREGMAAEALAELHAAIELDPDDPVIRLEAGIAQALSGNLDGAAEAFEWAIQLAPDDGWSLLLLGLTRLELGDLDESLRLLEEGARLRPQDLDAQLVAALALAAGGWEARALEMLERARMVAEGDDMSLVQEVDERIEDGAAVALAFLRESLAPSSLRDRLIERP